MYKRWNAGLILLTLLASALVLPRNVEAQGRNLWDWGADWEGDWYVSLGSNKMFLEYPYLYVSSGSGVRLHRFDPSPEGLTVSFLGQTREPSREEAFIVKNGLVVSAFTPHFIVSSRIGDTIEVQGGIPDIYSRYVNDISDDSIAVMPYGLVSLRDPSNPVQLWTSDHTLGFGATIVGDRLFARWWVSEWANESLFVYDISDPTSPVIIDTVAGNFNNSYLWPTKRIGNTLMFVVWNFTHGPGCIFVRLDDNADVIDTYWWSYWSVSGGNTIYGPSGAGVLYDSLFAVVNLDRTTWYERRLFLFDPDHLPDNPLVDTIELPFHWDYGATTVEMAFDDTLMVLHSYNSQPIRVVNVRDPHNMQVLLERRNSLLDYSNPALYCDYKYDQYLASFTGNWIADSPRPDSGLVILDLWTGGRPDTIMSFESIHGRTDYPQICDSLLLVSNVETANITLYTFSIAADQVTWRYRLPEIDWLSAHYKLFDLHRVDDTYYAAVADSEAVYVFSLGESSAQQVDSIRVNARIWKVLWVDQGLFLTAPGRLFWYLMNGNEEMVLVDQVELTHAGEPHVWGDLVPTCIESR